MHHYFTGGADRLSANRVESSNASDESTLVGCIGHVCKFDHYYNYNSDQIYVHFAQYVNRNDCCNVATRVAMRKYSTSKWPGY